MPDYTPLAYAGSNNARQRIAMAMLQNGVDPSPGQSLSQGAARVVNALIGGMRNQEQDSQDGVGLDAVGPDAGGLDHVIKVQGGKNQGEAPFVTVQSVMPRPQAAPEAAMLAQRQEAFAPKQESPAPAQNANPDQINGPPVPPQPPALAQPDRFLQNLIAMPNAHAGKGVLRSVIVAPYATSTIAPPSKAPSIEELEAAARFGLTSPEITNLRIKSPALGIFSQRHKNDLYKDGLNETYAPVTHENLKRLENLPGQFVTGEDWIGHRRAFERSLNSQNPYEREAASRTIEALDNFLPTVGEGDIVSGDAAKAKETFQQVYANESAARYAKDLDPDKLKAELRAGPNSGLNGDDSVRGRTAKTFLNEGHRLPSNEREMIKDLIYGTTFENALRKTGDGLGDSILSGAGAGATIGGKLGGARGVLLGAALGAAAAPTVGYGAKAWADKITLENAERLSKAIRERAPIIDLTR